MKSPARFTPRLRCSEFFLICVALLSLAMLLPALGVRDPFFARLRPTLFYCIAAYSSVTSIILALMLWRHRVFAPHYSGTAPRRLAIVWLLIATIAVGIFAHSAEGRHSAARAFVLNPVRKAALHRIGEHLIVGYRDPAFVFELIEHDAIGGVFITHHNVRERAIPQIRNEIAGFQARRKLLGRPPLWIATDQEGGSVSRLSPPLERQPFLSALLPPAFEGNMDGNPGSWTRSAALAQRLREHGAAQGVALADLGVNVNFSPVVDLRVPAREKTDSAMGWLDAFSRIETRAIHRDPRVVAFAAGEYARGLLQNGVYPTLKHFPGLGRLAADTHWFAAALPDGPATLRKHDWHPFRSLGVALPRASRAAMIPWIMLGHAHVPGIDPRYPASHSEKIVRGLLREAWKYDGVLITDDMNMRPIILGDGGMGGAAVRALNADVDLLLISYDGENVYPVLGALLTADRRGALDPAALQRSAGRLRRARLARTD
ncbi:MAG: glycoside hydrolase family 3 N-terminal domain-containing protein [Leptospirales bacterium]